MFTVTPSASYLQQAQNNIFAASLWIISFNALITV